MSLETDAREWLRKSKPKNKNIGSKTQRAQLAASILAGLLMGNRGASEDVLLAEAFKWADKILENN